MIKLHYKIFLIAISFFVSSLSYASISDESMDKLLVLSGLTMQIEQFPGLVKAGMAQAKQQGTPMSDAEYTSMVNSVDKSFVPSEIIEKTKINISKSINEGEAKKLLAWYESDLGREITLAEESGSTPEAFQEMMHLAQSLLSNSKQVEFAHRLDSLIGATELTMDIQEYTTIAVYSAIMTAMQPGVPVDLAPLKAQMDGASGQTLEGVKQMVTLSFVYAYRNIEIDKLKKYESFLNNVTTMKFNKVIANSLSKGFESSVSKLADELAKIYKENN